MTDLKANEMKIGEEYLIQSSQKHLWNGNNLKKYNYLNLTTDEKGLIRCTGRLSLAPLPYETRTPILLDPYHPLTKLIILDIHKRNKHIGYKHTLTELRQKFWIVQGRNLVRNLLRKCVICKKIEGKSYVYPTSPPLTALRLKDTYPFDTTGVDNFGPLFVKEVFYEKNDDKTYKAWVTLYTCASTRAILLDLVPRPNSTSFINSFRRMIARRGCPNNMISDNGKNFISDETQSFASNLGINWDLNLPLAPWHGVFFERLVRSTKTLLKKDLQNYKLSYDELQTVLFEVEMILNNRPLTYVYPDEIENALTPNHLLFGRLLTSTSDQNTPIQYRAQNITTQSKKISRIINHFWDRWHKEYVVNLRETHKQNLKNKHQQHIRLNDIVLIHDENIPRLTWRKGIVVELLKGPDGKMRGAEVRTPNGSILKRPITKLFPIEYFQLDETIVENGNENVAINGNENVDENVVRPKRNAAIDGEIRRRFIND